MKKDIRYQVLQKLKKECDGNLFFDCSKYINSLNLNTSEIDFIFDELQIDGYIVASNNGKRFDVTITIKGLVYLKEYDKFSNEYWLSKWKKRLFFPIILFTIVSNFSEMIIEEIYNRESLKSNIKAKERPIKQKKHLNNE